jgi:hypothetical protein
MPREYTIVAWGSERPEMTFRAATASAACVLALDKSVYASLQILVTDPDGVVITLDDLRKRGAGERSEPEGDAT